MRTSKLALALAVAGALSAGSVAGYQYSRTAGTAVAAPPVAGERSARALPDFAALVEQHGPAVVNISVLQQPDKAAPLIGGMPVRGQGSGFIVSADGLVLTNAHVVDGASEVNVKLTDKREFRAKVIGKDAQTDVAVLKIDARNLPVVKAGDPRALRPGEWVVAIGAPFGFENSVTAGVVSAKERALPDESYVPFIQSDVAVNPGNSGGPLFNLAGEVVGINSQILSRTGGYQGVSFAIPIDIALGIKDQIVAHGRVTRGYLGVTVQPLNAQLADSFGLKKPEGALVSSVVPGGPAAEAGLQPGDVILAVNGSPIASSSDLPVRVAGMKPGTAAQLAIWRSGSSKRVPVSVGELKAPQESATAGMPAAGGRLGLAVRPLTAAEQREAGTHGGLLVEATSGAAARAGVQPGDVILAMNGTLLSTAAQLRGMLANAGAHIALLVQRGEVQLFVPVTLG